MKKILASAMAAMFLTVAGASAVDAASYQEKEKRPYRQECEPPAKHEPQKKNAGPQKDRYEHRNDKQGHHKDRDHRRNDPRNDDKRPGYYHLSSDNQKQDAPKKAGPRESEN